jgi:hypothetical protein
VSKSKLKEIAFEIKNAISPLELCGDTFMRYLAMRLEVEEQIANETREPLSATQKNFIPKKAKKKHFALL